MTFDITHIEEKAKEIFFNYWERRQRDRQESQLPVTDQPQAVDWHANPPLNITQWHSLDGDRWDEVLKLFPNLLLTHGKLNALKDRIDKKYKLKDLVRNGTGLRIWHFHAREPYWVEIDIAFPYSETEYSRIIGHQYIKLSTATGLQVIRGVYLSDYGETGYEGHKHKEMTVSKQEQIDLFTEYLDKVGQYYE